MRLERAGLWEPQHVNETAPVAKAHAEGAMYGAPVPGDRDEADEGYRRELRTGYLHNAAGADSR